jgi:hypothetical protein
VLRRTFVLIATIATLLIVCAGSAIASEGQQLCIGSASSAVKPASDGGCPYGGKVVTLATQDEVSHLRERVDGLETKVTALEDKLAKVSYDPKGLNGLPTVKIAGANLQVVNGTGAGQNLNGLGNVIIGYDEHAADIKQTGSHNLVIGGGQTFTSWGDLLAGSENIVSAPHAVAFGFRNQATGNGSSVVGGEHNSAEGNWASVSGGLTNFAAGKDASLSGGARNRAGGQGSSVSGGEGNGAGGDDSSVSGGRGDIASASFASVSGGVQNRASGKNSSASGGQGNNAAGQASSVLGGHGIIVENQYETSP